MSEKIKLLKAFIDNDSPNCCPQQDRGYRCAACPLCKPEKMGNNNNNAFYDCTLLKFENRVRIAEARRMLYDELSKLITEE